MSKRKQIERYYLNAPGRAYSIRVDSTKATVDQKEMFYEILNELNSSCAKLEGTDLLLLDETFRAKKMHKVRGLAAVAVELGTFKTQFGVLLGNDAYRLRQELADSVTDYHNTFELARSVKRKFTLLLGPTNSGKTYEAMTHLAQSKSGCYFAPLRLLALEGQESLFERGVKCNLLTGEERQTMEGALHTSSTVEMLDPSRLIDTAVIDEVQLISDPDRGWAWTAAICGVPAKNVYLVGSEDCLPWVLPLLKYLGEEVEIKRFTRKAKLLVEKTPLARSLPLQAGDALIAFTRKDILFWRDRCKQKGLSCSLVYGSLSPEVRREQARLFQTGQTQVLIATDAVGMGLNLPIRRVIFTTLDKFDGTQKRPLHPWELSQIAGRAGRYGLQDEGLVTCFEAKGLAFIEECLGTPGRPAPEDTRVSVAPSVSHVTRLSTALDTASLGKILTYFQTNLVSRHEIFKTAQLDDVISLAWKTDKFPKMSLADRFVYACAPLEQRNDEHMLHLEQWLSTHNKLRSVPAPLMPDWAVLGGAERFLLDAEQLSKLYSVYCWLCFKFPELYNQATVARLQRAQLSKFIEKTLARHNKRGESLVKPPKSDAEFGILKKT